LLLLLLLLMLLPLAAVTLPVGNIADEGDENNDDGLLRGAIAKGDDDTPDVIDSNEYSPDDIRLADERSTPADVGMNRSVGMNVRTVGRTGADCAGVVIDEDFGAGAGEARNNAASIPFDEKFLQLLNESSVS
jgi:hypothetical protein